MHVRRSPPLTRHAHFFGPLFGSLCVCAALLLAGCDKKPADPPAAAAPAGPPPSGPAASGGGTGGPPTTVSAVPARRMDMDVLLEATGTAVPMSSVDLKPQLTGPITKVLVREGQTVRAGEVLFLLDTRPDEANVARLAAQLARDQAALADAQRQLQRSQELKAQNFVSQGAVDTNQAQVEAQTAAVSASRAALDTARLSLSYARVVAPGPGRVGAVSVFPGSVVQANVTTLATITQLDPIEVGFSLPQRHLADALAALKDGGAVVKASLPDDTTGSKAATFSGRLSFVDSAVDGASGTVKVKARFDNRDVRLWPGLFVRVSMTVRTLKDAVVVPQAAIVQSQRGSIVYAIENGKAALRPVQVLYAQGEDAAVSGVKPGERIVLDGRQNLRPGANVVERAREGGGGASGAGRRSGGGASGPAGGASRAASGS